MFGGICWMPSALRSRLMTIASLRNVVEMTTAIGTSASSASVNARTTGSNWFIPRFRTRLSFAGGAQHRDRHAEGAVDLHQLAFPDELALGADRDRAAHVAPEVEGVS